MTFPSFHDPTHLYFVTASVIAWKQLFITDEYAKIPLNSLAWMQQQKRILLLAFVIMPSHLHVIIKPENDSIAVVIQQLGSFTAHEILKKLRKQNQKICLISSNKRNVTKDMDIASGRTFRLRIFIQGISFSRKLNISTKTLLQKIGS